MKSLSRLFISTSFSALLLSGCGNIEMTSFTIEDAKHSLTIVREKPYFWSEGWDLALITTRQPACQRRHKLKHSDDENAKIELYRSYEGAIILRQDKHWYVTETNQCQAQAYPSPPTEPGELIGAFTIKDGQYQFVVEPLPASAPTAAPAR